MLAALRKSIGLKIVDISLAELIDAAQVLAWTRDPFDRLIAAHAIVANAPLVTADQRSGSTSPRGLGLTEYAAAI